MFSGMLPQVGWKIKIFQKELIWTPMIGLWARQRKVSLTPRTTPPPAFWHSCTCTSLYYWGQRRPPFWWSEWPFSVSLTKSSLFPKANVLGSLLQDTFFDHPDSHFGTAGKKPSYDSPSCFCSPRSCGTSGFLFYSFTHSANVYHLLCLWYCSSH